MILLDDKSKRTRWYNRNYLFIATILIIVTNILLYHFFGNSWNDKFYNASATWEDFSIFNVLHIMFCALEHADWKHVIMNMVSLFILGLYLERKHGSLKFLLINIFFMFTAPAMASHVKGNIYHHGYSGVIYALIGFLIIDYLFSFRRNKKNTGSIIIGAIAIAYFIISDCFGMKDNWAIYFTSVFNGLIHNMAHYTGFIEGVIFGLIYHILMMGSEHQTKLWLDYQEELLKNIKPGVNSALKDKIEEDVKKDDFVNINDLMRLDQLYEKKKIENLKKEENVRSKLLSIKTKIDENKEKEEIEANKVKNKKEVKKQVKDIKNIRNQVKTDKNIKEIRNNSKKN